MVSFFESFSQRPYAKPFLAIVALLAAGAVNSIFPGAPGALAMIVTLAVGYRVLFWLFRAAIALFYQRWNVVTKDALSAVVVLSLFLPALRSGHYIHLFLFYPYYAYAIHASGDLAPRRMKFEWGDSALFVTDSSMTTTLVYDESDLIETYVDSLGSHASADHLIGHFYLVYNN